MKQAIFKYPLELVATQVVKLPSDHGFVHAAIQIQGSRSVLCLWALVSDSPECEVTIKIVGTGHFEIKPTDGYIGTVHDQGMVWHIFEENA